MPDSFICSLREPDTGDLGGLRDYLLATRSPQHPALEESHQKSPAPSGVRSDVLRGLLEEAAISEEHRTLMGMMIERILSAESGLHEAFMSLLTGFEVREMMYIFNSTAHF